MPSITIFFIYTGNSLNDKQKIDLSIKLDSFHHYIATKDIDLNGNINYENGLYIPLDYSLKRAKQNSILICLEGANAGNKIGLINKDVCFVNKLACVSPFIVISKFVYYFFNSITFNNEFRDNMQGIIGGIPLSKFKSLSILIPPLQEQERIVNKIDKLFELVDKIEKDQQELEELKKQAKDKVLELAVTGKLVKQDPNDEPASVLLERIKVEKEKLIKEGKIKREKADLEPISDDDKNYYKNINSSWCVCRLSNVIRLTSGYDLTPNEYHSIRCDDDIPYMTGASNFTSNNLIVNRYTQIKYCNSHIDDILITCKGTIGKIAINTIGDLHIARQIMGITSYINTQFNVLLILNTVYKLQIKAKSMIPGIERNDLLNEVVAIPNLDEQERICRKFKLLNSLL